MATGLSTISELKLFLRFAGGLRGFLRQPLTREDCERRAKHYAATREENFLRTMERAIYAFPASPYRRLLDHAGVAPGDLKELVAEHGIEGSLHQLHDDGVRLTMDEFKGRTPIRRGSLEFTAIPRDFDNPLSVKHWVAETGGSRSKGARVYLDLEHFTLDAVYDQISMDALGIADRPYAMWRPTPPYGAGIKGALCYARLGLGGNKWFSQNRLPWTRRAWKHAAMATLAVEASRFFGRPIPRPEHVPLSEAYRIARWLSARTAEGRPAYVNTNAASGVRICLAALEHELNVSGTFFRFGGEPLTAAKAKVVADAGCDVMCHYTMAETGRLGIGCGARTEPDDVHMLTDKFAFIQKPKELPDGSIVGALNHTSILPMPPKLLLNLESDDYGVLEDRPCGCPLGKRGMTLHLHGIRSYEKLTSEGMNFLGSDLVRLVEEVLPDRFGGHPTDYQFVEDEVGGLPKVRLRVSPRVGTVDGGAVVDAVIHFLNHAPSSSDDYGERWREGNTLEIVRDEPIATVASKVHALHVTKKK